MALLNRRRFVASAGAAGAMFANACARKPISVAQTVPLQYATAPGVALCAMPRPDIDPAREIRTVVGLRPYRQTGFRVDAEKIGDALVIHNYGHGGGGITLSWGTARLAVDLAQGQSGAVAVLGSGAVGLATAMLAREAGFDVTLYTKGLPPFTTSNVAGGQWYPAMVCDHDKRTPQFNQQLVSAAEYAYRRYQAMVGPKFSIRWMRNYMADTDPWDESGNYGRNGLLAGVLPELRDLTPEENPFPSYPHTRQFDSMFIETPLYLAVMLDEIRIAGVRVVTREVHDTAELQTLPEKTVFNCTGLGAKALFSDADLIPVKGQLTVLLPQPDVQYATMFGDNYMFPRSDGILLGGTHVRGDWTMTPDLEAKQRVLAQHKQFVAEMRRCC